MVQLTAAEWTVAIFAIIVLIILVIGFFINDQRLWLLFIVILLVVFIIAIIVFIVAAQHNTTPLTPIQPANTLWSPPYLVGVPLANEITVTFDPNGPAAPPPGAPALNISFEGQRESFTTTSACYAGPVQFSKLCVSTNAFTSFITLQDSLMPLTFSGNLPLLEFTDLGGRTYRINQYVVAFRNVSGDFDGPIVENNQVFFPGQWDALILIQYSPTIAAQEVFINFLVRFGLEMPTTPPMIPGALMLAPAEIIQKQAQLLGIPVPDKSTVDYGYGNLIYVEMRRS